MVLQLNLPCGIDGLAPLPVILHGDVVNYELAIKIDRHLVSHHENTEAVPLPYRLIGKLARTAGVFLVVIQSSGTFAGPPRMVHRVPNLDLWTAPQIDAAVAAVFDFPIH